MALMVIFTRVPFPPKLVENVLGVRTSRWVMSCSRPDDHSKMVIVSSMKFSEVHITVPKYIPIDFGDDLDIRPDIRPDRISSNSTDLAETF